MNQPTDRERYVAAAVRLMGWTPEAAGRVFDRLTPRTPTDILFAALDEWARYRGKPK